MKTLRFIVSGIVLMGLVTPVSYAKETYKKKAFVPIYGTGRKIVGWRTVYVVYPNRAARKLAENRWHLKTKQSQKQR